MEVPIAPVDMVSRYLATKQISLLVVGGEKTLLGGEYIGGEYVGGEIVPWWRVRWWRVSLVAR